MVGVHFSLNTEETTHLAVLHHADELVDGILVALYMHHVKAIVSHLRSPLVNA